MSRKDTAPRKFIASKIKASEFLDDELKGLASLLKTQTSTNVDASKNNIALKLTQNQLMDKLKYHGIILLAAEQGTLPADLAAKTSKLKAMMIANDTLKQIELATLFDALNQAGISSVLIKGSALAYSLYPNPWLRPRSDSDILIAPADLSGCETVFKQLGYQKLFAINGEYVSYQNTYGKALAGDSFINIDLHWHINNRQMLSQTFTSKALLEDGQTLSHLSKAELNTNVNIPSMIDSLLIACLHRAGHHNKEERLTWLYDIHLLANRLCKDQWQQLCHRAEAKKIAAITLDALQTCEHILETKLNNDSVTRLTQAATKHEPSAIFLNRQLSERHYFWADLKSMPNLRSKLGFIRESLLPSPAYVRKQMNTPWATVGYIKRFVRGLKRVF